MSDHLNDRAMRSFSGYVTVSEKTTKGMLNVRGDLRSSKFKSAFVNAVGTKLPNDGKVILGSTVFLENLDNGEKINYKIVGKDEADLKQKLIYFMSPIGKGLIGKNKNDLIEINTPAGVKNFEIKDVKYI